MSDAKGEDPPERYSFERVHVGDADGTSRPTAHIITCGVPLRLASMTFRMHQPKLIRPQPPHCD